MYICTAVIVPACAICSVCPTLIHSIDDPADPMLAVPAIAAVYGPALTASLLRDIGTLAGAVVAAIVSKLKLSMSVAPLGVPLVNTSNPALASAVDEIAVSAKVIALRSFACQVPVASSHKLSLARCTRAMTSPLRLMTFTKYHALVLNRVFASPVPSCVHEPATRFHNTSPLGSAVPSMSA